MYKWIIKILVLNRFNNIFKQGKKNKTGLLCYRVLGITQSKCNFVPNIFKNHENESATNEKNF